MSERILRTVNIGNRKIKVIERTVTLEYDDELKHPSLPDTYEKKILICILSEVEFETSNKVPLFSDDSLKKNEILEKVQIDDVRSVYFYSDENGNVFFSRTGGRAFGKIKSISTKINKKDLIIKVNKFKRDPNLYLVKKDEWGEIIFSKRIGKFHTPKESKYSIATIHLNDLIISQRYDFYFGNNKGLFSIKPQKPINLCIYSDSLKAYLFVLQKKNSISIFPNKEKYVYNRFYFRVKMKLAQSISKLIKNKKYLCFHGPPNIINDSTYYMFERILEYLKGKSKNYKPFLIYPKEKSEIYKMLKKKHGLKVSSRTSFLTLYRIFNSKACLSSHAWYPLSMSLIAPTPPQIANYVTKHAKWIHLQHGVIYQNIKFSLPGHLYAMVVSSEFEEKIIRRLSEAKHMPKFIRSGLPVFDIREKKKEGDTVSLMLHFDKHENKGKKLKTGIQFCDTKYYKNFLKVKNLIHKQISPEIKVQLLLHPHTFLNQTVIFKGCENVVQDITKGINQTQLYITDISSSALDAFYRGIPVIYYFADGFEHEYEKRIDENVFNNNTAPGLICGKDTDMLIKEVKRIRDNGYKQDQKYIDRYRVINEFSDDQNYKRVIEELVNEKILPKEKK